MKHFIGYFDFLGYKKFIENNDSSYTRKRLENILIDIETCLGRGNYEDAGDGGYRADLSKFKIECLNISDTVIFWTKDDSEESLEELLDVCYKFHWALNLYNFPVRGVIVYDEIEIIRGSHANEDGGMFNINMIYGKGLIKAHIKAENQSWAGCTIDNTVIEYVKAKGKMESFIDPIALEYLIPYKKVEIYQQLEYALKLSSGPLNDEAYKNWKRDIIRVFEGDNKGTGDPRVEVILENTLKFLDIHSK